MGAILAGAIFVILCFALPPKLLAGISIILVGLAIYVTVKEKTNE